MYKFNYDILEYPFEDIVSDWLETDDLSKLHEFKQYKLFKRINDQSSMWHKMFYNQIRIDSRFNDIYMRFLTEYIKPKSVSFIKINIIEMRVGPKKFKS